MNNNSEKFKMTLSITRTFIKIEKKYDPQRN